MKRSRFKKLNHFYSLCDPWSNVLDVGVSKHNSEDQANNTFLKKFRFGPKQYTGLAVQSMDEVKNIYPSKKFVEYSGGIFPFNDKEFDWVFSNAVIEHVGTEADQIQFINEMLRVSKSVFFTTPNKYFPVESHTNKIFRHWSNKRFYKWIESRYPNYNIKHLLLLGNKDLKKLINLSNANHYQIKKNRIFGLTMTFTVVCTD